MFIAPPNNFNQTPMWNNIPMFSPVPMMPLQNFDSFDDTRQKPMYPTPPTPPTPPSNEEFEVAPGSPVQNNLLYNQGWLTTQIGQYVKIEFLIGTTMLIDREGILKQVGISYVVIEESGTNDIVMCDIYSIKFVRVYSNPTKRV
jgi:hypothetical protein